MDRHLRGRIRSTFIASTIFMALFSVQARANQDREMAAALCGARPIQTSDDLYGCTGCPFGVTGAKEPAGHLFIWDAIEGHFTSDRPQKLAMVGGCRRWGEIALFLMTLTESGWVREFEIPQAGTNCLRMRGRDGRHGVVCRTLANDGKVSRERYELLTFHEGKVVRKPFLEGFWTVGGAYRKSPNDCSAILAGQFGRSEPDSNTFTVIARARGLAGKEDACETNFQATLDRAGFWLSYSFDGNDVRLSTTSATDKARLEDALRGAPTSSERKGQNSSK